LTCEVDRTYLVCMRNAIALALFSLFFLGACDIGPLEGIGTSPSSPMGGWQVATPTFTRTTCSRVTPDWVWQANAEIEECYCEEREATATTCGTCSVEWFNDKGLPQGGTFVGTCENVECCAP
jgi:hypothetical protein